MFVSSIGSCIFSVLAFRNFTQALSLLQGQLAIGSIPRSQQIGAAAPRTFVTKAFKHGKVCEDFPESNVRRFVNLVISPGKPV